MYSVEVIPGIKRYSATQHLSLEKNWFFLSSCVYPIHYNKQDFDFFLQRTKHDGRALNFQLAGKEEDGSNLWRRKRWSNGYGFSKGS